MDKERLLQLIQDSFDRLVSANILENRLDVNLNMTLLGKESKLDSLGFVSFISDIEERLSDEVGKEIYLVLDEITEFDINRPQLSVGHFVQYLDRLVK